MDGDDVFFETPDSGRVCIGGGPFGLMLTCTRMGGFEVWNDPNPKTGRCIAGEGYAGPSRIEIGGVVVFERTAEQWAEAAKAQDI